MPQVRAALFGANLGPGATGKSKLKIQNIRN
jgi:hypothetical protein